MPNSENGTPAKPPETVDEALDKFWIAESIQGHVPDYVGFMAWINNREEAARNMSRLPLHAEEGSGPALDLSVQLLNAAEDAGINITAEKASLDRKRFGTPDGKPFELKFLNQVKLLLHYFSGIPRRQREMFAMLAKAASSKPSVTPRSSQLVDCV